MNARQEAALEPRDDAQAVAANARALCAGALLLVCAGNAAAPAQERVAFRHLTIADGLSQNAVSAIVPDRRAFMWFGTKDGLNRYDGYQFVVFRHDPFDSTSISDSEITTLFEGSRGRLWVGTRGGGVNRFDRSRERFERLATTPRNITAIAEDSSGSIWVGAFDPKANRFATYRRPENPSSRLAGFSVYTIFEDRSNTLWIDAGLLYQWNRATGASRSFETTSSRPDDFGNTGVWSIVEDPPGFLWAATFRGLCHYEIASGRARQYRYDAADSAGLPEPVPYDVFRDRDGVIWAVTENFLARLVDADRGRFQAWRHKERATSGQWVVRSILPDHQQPSRFLWVGTAGGGLNRLDMGSGSFVHLIERDGLPNNVVHGVRADTSGKLWLSTNKGLSRVDPATRRFRNYDIWLVKHPAVPVAQP